MKNKDECEYKKDCTMFDIFTKEYSEVVSYVSKYCEGPDKEECERYKLKITGKYIPKNLLPNGRSMMII